jgi:hypothetical protein
MELLKCVSSEAVVDQDRAMQTDLFPQETRTAFFLRLSCGVIVTGISSPKKPALVTAKYWTGEHGIASQPAADDGLLAHIKASG